MIKAASICVAVVAACAYLVITQIRTPSGHFTTSLDDAYDFIIVGAGTSGCVLAARLTEDPTVKVLLVEAGGEESWMSLVPLVSSYLQTTEMNWAYKTVSQSLAMDGLHKNEALWPRGKGLGGSSSINNMIHMMGVPNDYDTWWRQHDLQGLGHDDFKRYLKKSEDVGSQCTDDRGCDGPMKITRSHDDGGLGSILLKAVKELKIFGEGTYDDNDGLGFARTESNTFEGKRYGTAQAYLRPAMSRPNLHVLINAKVTKVLFSGVTARGVKVVADDGTIYEPQVTREVILSAGTISSPHLLMLSGIGNSQKLHRLGIKVVKDLPAVGEGLSDQLALPIYFHLGLEVSLNAYKLKSMQQALRYLITRKGYFSQTGVEVVGRIAMKNETKNSSSSRLPELLLLALNFGSVDKDLYTGISNMKSEAFDAIFPGGNNESKEGFILLSVCLHPRSRGHVEVTSPNPFIPPIINPRYLTDDHDTDCLTKGYKFAWQLAKTESMKSAGGKLHLPTHARCAKYPKEISSKEYLRCLVRATAITAYHPVGTCAMGPVVDSELRVKGVLGVRVVDASVLPRQVSGTPHATIVAVAEKAADMVRAR